MSIMLLVLAAYSANWYCSVSARLRLEQREFTQLQGSHRFFFLKEKKNFTV